MTLISVRAHLSKALAGKKLFLKIFLWFWCTVLLMLALVVSPSLVSVKVLRPPNLEAVVVPLLAAQATHAYETEGPEGFRRFARENIEDHDKVLYLLDGDYKDVLGRPVPEEGIRLAHRVHGGELTVYRSQIGAFRLVSSSGHPFVFLLYLNKELKSLLGSTSLQRALFPIAILTLVTLLCYGLARHIASPVMAIQAAAQQVSRGDLQARAPAALLRRHDEMRELTRDFNTMVGRIESLVNSHKRLLASVSHEVRSPLTRLTIAVALLRRPGRVDSAALLDRIEREVSLVDVLMGQLLTLARLEGGVRRDTQPANLKEILEEIIADASFEVEPFSKTIQLSAASSVILLGADAAMLRSALENVIRNAAKFAPPGSCVDVHLTLQQNAAAVILVQDRGPGVPEAHLEDIFRAFFRVPSDAETHAGNGLGLAIAAEAISLHGGTIRASNREGGGLEIQVTLPPGGALPVETHP